MSPFTRSSAARRAVVALALMLAIVAAVAGWGALEFYGHPVAGALLDAGGRISSVGPSEWDAKGQGLQFPDRVVAVEGARLERARDWDRAALRAVRSGRTSLSATIEKADGSRVEASLRIDRLSGWVWWLLAGATVAVGVLWAGAGLLALWVSPDSPLARTTARVGVAVGLFMLGLFDLHTSRRLVPLFFLGFAMVPFAFVLLALRLPDDTRLLNRAPWLERAADAAGLLLGGALVIQYLLGASTQRLQTVASTLLAFGFCFFVATFSVRLALATGQRRRTMRALAWAMIPPHALAGMFVVLILGDSRRFSDLLFYPMLGLAPLATLYAVVRYDIWGSRALLSRLLTRGALLALGWSVSAAVGAGVAMLFGVDFAAAMAGSAAAAGAAVFATVVLLELADRWLFPSHAAYKPSVAQLSAELADTTSPSGVAEALERTVVRWLGCEHAALVLRNASPRESGAQLSEPPEPQALPDGGRVVQIQFAGMMLGVLEVGPKRDSALYTSTDMELLATIADQGGLALAHAHAYQELELRRREQARAWRGEREALVETVAGEIAHEIRHPINLFRSLLDSAAGGAALDEEEIDVGREEVERLERLVAGLRRLRARRVERRNVALRELCERAERVLRDAMGGRSLELDIPAELELCCDLDKSVQVLVNLLSNALEASAPHGRAGVRWSPMPRGGKLVVWDTGPGFEGDGAQLFAPWHTTKPHGTGLGLAISYRLVRAHEWDIVAERTDRETQFVVSVRASDIVGHDADHMVEVA